MKRKKMIKIKSTHLLLYTVLLLFAFCALFPVVYTILGSFKSTRELYSGISFRPEKFVVENYIKIWSETNVLIGLRNSLILCATAIVSQLFTNTLTAYVLARKKRQYKFVRIIDKIYTVSVFISLPVVTIYPIYRLIVGMGLNTSLLGLMLLNFGGSVANVMLIKGNLMSIGSEIDEAAQIDGCSFFRIYWNIILPLLKPIMATITILTVRGVWNSYLMPMIITMGVDNLKPLSVAVVELRTSGHFAADIGVAYAGASISIVPLIIVYLCCNKYFVTGITAGAVKG